MLNNFPYIKAHVTSTNTFKQRAFTANSETEAVKYIRIQYYFFLSVYVVYVNPRYFWDIWNVSELLISPWGKKEIFIGIPSYKELNPINPLNINKNFLFNLFFSQKVLFLLLLFKSFYKGFITWQYIILGKNVRNI